MLEHVILINDFNCTKISFENLNIRKSNLFVTIVMLMCNLCYFTLKNHP